MEQHTEKHIKLLPRLEDDTIKREFIANGKKYIIRTSDEVLGINRANAYSAINAMMTLNFEDPQALIEFVGEMRNTLGKALGGNPSFITKHAALVETLWDSIIQFSKSKYKLSQQLCTIFIVRDDEDLRHYSTALANEKIEDWAKEGYHRNDFLGLAVNFSQEHKDALVKRLSLGKEG